ncbi:uncharacterized protein LOC110726809 [Chenopodium quinoa]|uniref:uncharacterized protein LOC110726809 n=1 Tax=Chenopodium quinoa TaxID=63459 RepID=UPI000B77F520|nr:uncharacterized protein LOC110726809 [Chenopodium quinoa]
MTVQLNVVRLNTLLRLTSCFRVKLYQHVLLDRQERILNVRYPGTEKKIVTIAELRSKKASNATPDETAWIKVTIPEADLQRVNAYIGYLGCGKRTYLALGTRFPCISCKKGDTVATHKVTFKFEAVDDSGMMSFTTFSDDTEKLFRMTASEIWNMKTTGNLETFKVVQETLSTKPFFIQVTPTLELARNSVLLWTLKAIEVEDTQPETQVLGSSSANLNKDQTPFTPDKAHRTEQAFISEAAAYSKKDFNISPSTTKAHGKAIAASSPDSNANYSQDNTETSDEVLAEIAQLHEFRLASEAFDTDCFDIPIQQPNKGLTISKPPTSVTELPTWNKLTRTRSSVKNKEPMSADEMQDSDDEDPVPRKKLRTALFKEAAEKEISENKE